MAIKKNAVTDANKGAETAVDPGEAPLAQERTALDNGIPPTKEEVEAIQEYKEVTGDPTGAARNSAEAGVLAVANATNPETSPEVLENIAKAQEEARAKALKEAGAETVKTKPRSARLKAVKYPMKDPKTGAYIPLEGTVEKVQVSNWMQAQIDIGLVVEVKD